MAGDRLQHELGDDRVTQIVESQAERLFAASA
jgi:hypothetical protein